MAVVEISPIENTEPESWHEIDYYEFCQEFDANCPITGHERFGIDTVISSEFSDEYGIYLSYLEIVF